MTILSFRAFNGEIPRLPADRLPEGAAQLARNCDFAHGELRSIKALGAEWTADAAAQPVRALFTDNGLRFFCWAVPTRAYLAPTIDDTARRVYYQAHDQGLRVAQTDTMVLSSLQPGPPSESWEAGVSAPAVAPGLAITGTATGTDVETVAYVAVAINIWGEESAPSPAATIDVTEGEGVQITIDHTADANQVPFQGIILYRTYASNQSADFYLLTPTPLTPSGTTYTFNDTTTATPTTTVLASEEWDVPPDGLGNLSYAGNGFFAASLGKDLLFSEPYRPHAWPYRMSFPHGIVGVVAAEGGLVVTTQAGAYSVYGAHPTQMGQTALMEQAGVSDTAIARVESMAIYASNDGLVSVAGGQPSLESSQQLYTRKDWRARYKAAFANLRLAAHDGHVLGLIDPTYPAAAPGGVESFLIRIDEDPGAHGHLDVGTPIYGAAIAATEDVLYVGTATGFAEFAGGADDLTLVWHSGDTRYPRPVSFAAAMIDCDGDFTVEVLADGNVVHAEVVDGTTEFRLGDDVPMAVRWSVRLTGEGVVRSVDLGASFSELAQA